MTTPAVVRRLRTYFTDAQTRRLRTQLTASEARNRSLEQRLADLQAANEAADRRIRETTGGAAFDPEQPFGVLPADGAAT
ncbi:hypothetical protein KMT30_06650 [Streptomyces sp. IBSBF 2953]|nr:hypothetical protein [Streptomyces hayashii]